MNKLLTAAAAGWMVLFALVPSALAVASDQYPGDSAIYGVQAPLQPNVLVIIDDSGSMANNILAADYDGTTTYTPRGRTCSGNYCCMNSAGTATECVANNLYVISSTIDTTSNSELYYTHGSTTTVSTLGMISSTLKCGTSTIYPNNALSTSGTYSGYTLTPGSSSVTCGSSGSTIYATGNYITYLNTPMAGLTPKYLVAQSVVKNLIASSDNIKFGLMTYGASQTGGKLLSVTPAWSKITGTHPSGTVYTTFAQKMDTQFPSGYAVTNTALNTPCIGPIGAVCTNRDALNTAIASLGASGGTPIGQVLVEAGRSFCGCDSSSANCGVSPYGNTVGIGTNSGTTVTGYCNTDSPPKASYISPIDAPCQANYIVLVTDGMSTLDDQDLISSGGPGILEGLCPWANASSSAAGNCASDGCGCCTGSATNHCKYTTGSSSGSCSSSSSQCAAYAASGSSGNSGLGIDNAATQVASFLYNGTPKISTFAIGFDLTGSDLAAAGMLTVATDNNHGHGAFYSATSQADISRAFSQIMAKIYQVNSSYVAPVVPSSPQNRTYSGNRIYMGFFEPQQNTTWFGNLKKYGIGNFTNSGTTYNNVVTDATGVPATWIDLNKDGLDDIYGTNLAALPAGNGSFKNKGAHIARSFWSPSPDADSVNAGGVGSQLEALSSATNRTLYSQTSSGGALVTFNSTNITPSMLGYTSGDTTDATNLINFTYGQDVLNEAGSGTSANRSWMMADVLHSQPLIINYSNYTPCNPCLGDTCVCATGNTAVCTGGVPVPNNCNSPTVTANEQNCAVNKTFVFVGSNDGMLHAFKDCDGSEAWGFIPYEFLPTLQNNEAMVNNLITQPHSYFVDATVAKYVYNKLGDGNINTATNGDKVILMFGTRRGGGNATAPTTGLYYAMDASGVANASPVAPTLLWSINQSSTGFSELAESWSTPNIVTMKVNGATKVVAVFGAGYDNPNEDARFGATQYFNGSAVAASATGQGNITSTAVTSSGTAPYAASPKGRGIYLVEVATLNSSGVPSFTNSGKLIWSYTYGSSTTSSSTAKTDPNMTYSIPSDITAWDVVGSGNTSRLYAADMGGNLWRFDLSDQASSANWSGQIIFKSNPCLAASTCSTGGDVGRKMFYKPSAVRMQGGAKGQYVQLYFGTGDREHPTNTAVTDRLYSVKDPVDVNYPSGTAPTLPLTESNLMDVTADTLQLASTSASTVKSLVDQLNGKTAMSGSNYAYGWYIKLNSGGEKVLAAPVVFNGDATYNTYTPIAASGSTNSCTANLGTATQYDVSYLTGEAIMNKDTSNDTVTTTNGRALYNNATAKGTYFGLGGTGVLQASDRSQVIGTGIPSGSVVVITPGGQTESLTGGGGSIITGTKNPGGALLRLYWRQK
jgi:type IV pilus assembly protein PilY1